ncbi:helix-turn-helix domain-containing protein [Streptomyces massasporeus]|uniref:helix-turn-helix domain-containing protein n=1 Tax=Streptomyces massasporeus TaxID=67324 RepID=UPI0037B5B16D
MTRADRLELVRQLRHEGMSQRAIAKRLKVSKDTVRRDFERLDAEDAPDDEPPGEPSTTPDDADAPQVSAGDQPDNGGDGAPRDEPPGEPVAHLTRRASADRLDIDLRRRPGLRRDLALLAQTGCTAEQLVVTAVRVLAAGYQQGLAAGDVLPGRPFSVTRLSVAALALPGPRVPPVPSPATPGGSS